MRHAIRPLRLMTVLAIVGASLGTSVSIDAINSRSDRGADIPQDVEEGASAHRLAERTGNTSTVEEPEVPQPPAPPPPPPASPTETKVLELVNVERTSRGLQPLSFDHRLNQAAEAHSVHQSQVGTIFHTAPDGTTPGDRILAVGYSFSAWAENVAAGHSTPEMVVTAWMNSPGHCKNLLNPSYVHIGVGYVNTSSSFRHWWTQKFGRPAGTPSPPGTYNPAWC